MKIKLLFLISAFVVYSLAGYAQGFSSGPVPLCDTSYFTQNVSGVGIIQPSWSGSPGFTLDGLLVNITTDHPQTLQILLTSPSGTTLLLSAFNGAGGVNYTNTYFTDIGSNIVGAAAPFNGTFTPQGGSFSIFDYEFADGLWTVTVIDTACSSAIGPGWTAGYFDGSIGGGLVFIQPPCNIFSPPIPVNLCQGQSVNLYNYIGPGVVNFFPSPPDPANVTAGGFYSYNSWDGFCTFSGEIDVSFSATPQLGNDTSITNCSNSIIDLNAIYNTSGFIANWTANNIPIGFATASAINTPGIYQLIAGNATGCMDTVTVTVTIAPVLAGATDQNITACSSTPFDLTTVYNTSGVIGAWYSAGLPVATPASISSSGIYNLVVSNGSGCTDTLDVNLSLASKPVLGSDQALTVCSNQSVDLNTLYNTAGYASAWTYNNFPVANPSAVNAAGSYTLIAGSTAACSDTALVILTSNSAPVLGADQSLNLCANATLNLATLYNTGLLTANWTYNNLPVLNSSSVNLAGTYSLIATDVNACSDTALVSLSTIAAPALGNDITQTICANNTIDLTSLYVTGGMLAQWSFNASVVANPSAVNSPGTYSLTATSLNGCIDTADVFLNVVSSPVLGLDQAVNLCSNLTADLNILFPVTGLTTTWTYNNLPVTNPASVNVAGNYELIATAAGGCADTAIASINLITAPQPGAPQLQTICSNSSIDLTSLFVTNGYGVTWMNNSLPVINPSAVNTAGIYELTLTDAAGCTGTSSVTLNLLQSPSLGADQPLMICNGSAVDLTTLYPVTGLLTDWTFNNLPVTLPSAVSAAGPYQLIVTNINNCMDTAITMISVSPGVSIGSDQVHDLCQWMTLDLSALYNLTGLTATYLFNSLPVTNYTSVSDSGIYTVSVIDNYGCTDEAFVRVNNVVCLCDADFRFTGNCIEEPVSFELQADSLIKSAHWSFGTAAVDNFELNPSVLINTTNKVEVTLVAELSCGEVTVTKDVQLTDCSSKCNVYFPSAFTPNNDGINDSFTWTSVCEPETFRLRVMNRFGQLLFETSNPQDSWDGTYEQQVIPAGIYIVHAEYKLPYQEKSVSNTTIALQR